ncbi:hypothetical protein TRVL_05632 [Trypanosoma vivax]|nr:hypothetical protein TRVL_05632 [Trypanosoma vivax]
MVARAASAWTRSIGWKVLHSAVARRAAGNLCDEGRSDHHAESQRSEVPQQQKWVNSGQGRRRIALQSKNDEHPEAWARRGRGEGRWWAASRREIARRCVRAWRLSFFDLAFEAWRVGRTRSETNR